jgi:hypothetical protein
MPSVESISWDYPMKVERPDISSLADVEDELLRLEFQVARRADELARSLPSGGGAGRDRETWRQAERELFREPAARSIRRTNLLWPQ